MQQPKKTISIDSQIEKIMALLDNMSKAVELKATVKFRNILNVIYENEVSKLEKLTFKQDTLPQTGGTTINNIDTL